MEIRPGDCGFRERRVQSESLDDEFLITNLFCVTGDLQRRY